MCMPRTMRVEEPGAIYPIMDRSSRKDVGGARTGGLQCSQCRVCNPPFSPGGYPCKCRF